MTETASPVDAEVAALDRPLDKKSKRAGYLAVGLVGAGLLALGAAMVIAANVFARSEIDSQLRDWQTSLGIVAENSNQAIGGWLERQRRELTSLADNETVRLFFFEWELADGDIGAIPDLRAQTDYLGNLLTVSASRGGFDAPLPAGTVRANIDQRAAAGLYLQDRNGTPIAASTNLPPAINLADVAPGSLDLAPLEGGGIRLSGKVAVFPSQALPVAGGEAGYITGFKPVTRAVGHLIQPPQLPDFTPRVVLLQRTGAALRPLAVSVDDSDYPLDTQWAVDTADLAEGFAVSSPGGFATLTDSTGAEVLATSRQIGDTPLYVMVTVPRDIALGAIEQRYDRFQIVIWLFIGLLGAVIAVIWRHGASVRATELMRQYRDIARSLSEQKELLDIVTDSQPTSIFILDHEHRFRFANAVCAAEHGVGSGDLIDKTIEAVIGPARSEHYTKLDRRALEERAVVRGQLETAENVLRPGSPERVVTTEHVPLPRNTELDGCVLVVERDITAEVVERRRREQAQQDLIETLVSVVDMRDRNAANHSRRVGLLAQKLAHEMELDPVLIGTARTAGILMNLGKILVPESTLQSERQSADERAMVRAGIRATADLLADVQFAGPVLETLAQVQEHVDGSGEPAGLKGEEILITARLISVANALVSMLSPRSYRDALPVDVATGELKKQMDTVYDAGVVGALLSLLSRPGGRDFIEQEIRSVELDELPELEADGKI